ncbi:MAG: single-stranded-DNA-specific exonuclease RecJ [Deferribacteres bacterium]|nr:single-stranded-DNA-specific exonuclease RecJ [candidate division KSB1 bacterium]MCB9508861.1 single-stranded-DNA-specific exonuclease RecJ [Deferribacteres bacterium]
MQTSWTLTNAFSDEIVTNLAKQLTIPNVLARVLLNRGIDSFDQAKSYFRADIEHLYDPFIMADMEKAVTFIVDALQNKRKILIYGDYDVDGTTSTAMLILFFRQLGYFVDYHIPNRIQDGYGMSIETVEAAHKKGVDLIITVDCGITAIEEIKHARKLGLDVIVCDHHQPGPELPDAIAVLNPKRSDCPYPFKELAGVGVSFKLAQAIAQKVGHSFDELSKLLDLVAIGSAADIVPLVDENRIIVREGLKVLNETGNLGLRALLRNTGLAQKTIGTGQIIFILAPRINAVGRMGDASRAVDMLIAQHESQAYAIASILEHENKQRRNLDEETFKRAVDMVESKFDPENDAAFVLNSEEWHLGVIGIVASRLVEKYYRPTVMISTENGIGKGSARSVPGFNIYDALEHCSDLMMTFGGHKYAAGLSIEKEKIEELRERLKTYTEQNLTGDMRVKTLSIDGELAFSEIDDKFMRILKMMAPFGPQNMRPVFMSSNVQVVGNVSVVGKNHLRFRASQDGIIFDTIGFNLGGLLHRVTSNPKDLEIAYLVEENEWQGRISTQLRIKDIR